MTDKKQLAFILEKGQPLILPTETVYGLFAKALSEEAVDRVYQYKERPRDKAMNLNVFDYNDILRYSKQQPTYLPKLYKAFLPGPLTIILKANDKVPKWINSGLSSIGFRLPTHPLTRALIQEQGPLIGPSANKSGQESGKQFKSIVDTFDHLISGYEDDTFLTGQDSTILDLSTDMPRILREGAISKEDLIAVIPELHF